MCGKAEGPRVGGPEGYAVRIRVGGLAIFDWGVVRA